MNFFFFKFCSNLIFVLDYVRQEPEAMMLHAITRLQGSSGAGHTNAASTQQ